MANLWRAFSFCFTMCIIKKNLVTFVFFSILCTMVWSFILYALEKWKTVLEVNWMNEFCKFLEGEGTSGTQNTHSMLEIK
jgi:hypothetical protein